MTARFVLVGFAAELSLRPLATALEQRGLPTVLVDLAERAVSTAHLPPGDGPLVLVSSQHLALTGAVYDAHTGLTSSYVAPQALARTLGADLLVYVPHDLSEPVLPAEVDLLSTVDLYAAPDADSWWAAAHVRTVVTGWVGSAWSDDAALAAAPLSAGVLFLTQVQWLMLKGGASFVRSSLARTLASGVAVKLPVWPGLASVADALRADGVPLVDPLLSAAGIARRTPLVLTNGPSSVLAEAVDAGHRPLCVMPTDAEVDFAGQVAALDVAVCRDEDVVVAAASAGRVRPANPPFDVDAFLAAVDRALRERR